LLVVELPTLCRVTFSLKQLVDQLTGFPTVESGLAEPLSRSEYLAE
jgi:hypothetical protein